MKKIEVKKLQQKLQSLKNKADALDEKQKKNAIIIGAFIIMLSLSLISDFLGALIPIALVSYMLSQVGGVREELKKLRNSNEIKEEVKEEKDQQ